MDRKVYLRCKGKTLLGVVNKLLKVKVMGLNPAISINLLYFKKTIFQNCLHGDLTTPDKLLNHLPFDN